MKYLINYFDDFYQDAENVRNLALMGEFVKEHNRFTGTECTYDQFPMHLIFEKIASLLKRRIYYNPLQKCIFRSLTLTEFRMKTNFIHVDHVGVACVICLNKEYDENHFTSFYRHKPTGLIGITDRVDLLKVAYKKRALPWKLEKQIISDGRDLNKWELTRKIQYKFNRLILFDSNLFHLAAPGFGATIEDAKLIQTFSFRPYNVMRIDHRLIYSKTKKYSQ